MRRRDIMEHPQAMFHLTYLAPMYRVEAIGDFAMAKSVLSAPRFHSEEAAFEYVEAELWPTGPVCPHCGATGAKIGRLTGKTTRPGLRKCYACPNPFTVRMGPIFEDSHPPLAL